MARSRKTAAASGPATLQAMLDEIESGWPAGLTVLTGGDLFHLDRAQRALLEALAPAGDSEFALTVYGEQRVDVAGVVAAARSVGMFSPRRVVLVRDVAAFDGEPDALLAYAADPPPASHLIVRAPQLDRRRKLHQVLVKSGRLCEFAARDPRDASRMAPEVMALARERGLSIDRRAAGMLAEICAADFQRIDSELEKLRSWTGEAADEAVTIEALREVAAGSAALSGWEVASALTRADRPGALGSLSRLLVTGDEPLRMLGGIAYRARSVLQARAMMERGVPAQRAVASARIWGEAPAQTARGLAAYSLADVLRFPSLLLEADRTLKSRAIAPGAVLGTMLERMIPSGQGSQS